MAKKSETIMSQDEIDAIEKEMMVGEDAPKTDETIEPDSAIDLVADDIVKAEEKRTAKAKAKSEPGEDKGQKATDTATSDKTLVKDTGKPPPDFVPHQAFHAEREERKKAEERLRKVETEQREREARLEERLNILSEALKPQQAAVPSPDEDIISFSQSLADRLARVESQSADVQWRTADERRQQDEFQRLSQAYRADAAVFGQRQADFNEAYQFLLASRDAELQAIGYADPAQRWQAIQSDELNIAQNAFQQGRSPAEAIYNLAKLRGFKPVEQEKSEEPSAKGNGQTAEEKIKQLAKAKEATTNLSRGGGTAEGSRFSLDSLDRMPKKEFDALIAKLHKTGDEEAVDKLLAKAMGLDLTRTE